MYQIAILEFNKEQNFNLKTGIKFENFSKRAKPHMYAFSTRVSSQFHELKAWVVWETQTS